MADEREVLEIDVLFVGAGPACLAGAYHLAQKMKEKGEEIAIAVIEKSDPVGAHALSGAVMDPRGLQEVMPDFKERGAPLEAEVALFDLERVCEGPIVARQGQG